MAIVNSVSLGKVGGKLGNVVFQSYAGQVVARQKNDYITGEPTPAQITQRANFSSAGTAYSYLSNFLGDAVGIIKASENMSGAFSRITSHIFGGVKWSTPIEAADALDGHILGVSNFVSITEFKLSGALPEIKFNKIYGDYDAPIYVNMITFNVVSGAYNHKWAIMSEAEYNAGVWLYPDTFDNIGVAYCYIALPSQRMCSEIYCQST